MQIIQSRRDFLAGLSAAGAASALGSRASFADEPPPEVTTIRLRFEDAPPSWINGVADNGTCNAPILIPEELLRAEGFTDVRYVRVKNGPPYAQAFERHEIDFTLRFAPGAVRWLDAGVPITVLAGVHPGCFGLFAHEPVRTFTDLKGKQAGIEDVPQSAQHLFLSIMAAHVGLDPERDIIWITTDDVANPMELFVQGKIDALLAFVSEFPELRARKSGRMILDMTMDAPWSQYFCCMVVAHRDFVGQYPVATKRALRAILKATDLCATNPAQAARQMVEGASRSTTTYSSSC
jgi:NitT/TauT family transport system substrate-binding protein